MQWARTRVRHWLERLEGRRPGPAATRVLVVDDDEVIRQLIGVHLRVAGLAADLAWDGLTGLKRARAARPDVAVIDARMPGLDGWAVAAQLRADPATRSVRIIVLEQEAGGVGRESCADVCLAKPFDPAELIATVRRLARRTPTRSPPPRPPPPRPPPRP
jgi:DNA-binding response OmpR family regulator